MNWPWTRNKLPSPTPINRTAPAADSMFWVKKGAELENTVEADNIERQLRDQMEHHRTTLDQFVSGRKARALADHVVRHHPEVLAEFERVFEVSQILKGKPR